MDTGTFVRFQFESMGKVVWRWFAIVQYANTRPHCRRRFVGCKRRRNIRWLCSTDWHALTCLNAAAVDKWLYIKAGDEGNFGAYWRISHPLDPRRRLHGRGLRKFRLPREDDYTDFHTTEDTCHSPCEVSWHLDRSGNRIDLAYGTLPSNRESPLATKFWVDEMIALNLDVRQISLGWCSLFISWSTRVIWGQDKQSWIHEPWINFGPATTWDHDMHRTLVHLTVASNFGHLI
jgi:hypothetical protein